MKSELIGNEWDEVLKPIFASDTYLNLREFLKDEYSHHIIYPNMYDIFNAFKLTPPSDVKVVILGQDPYINKNQAEGLAFSVKETEPPPPSLVNIFKEISDDLGVPIRKSPSLVEWAKQGVLLLNSVLTVRSGLSNSHKGKGWEELTSAAVAYLLTLEQPMVFVLWGRGAENVFYAAEGGVKDNILVLKAPHPSPLSASRGFFGCKHFSRANEFLRGNGVGEIKWV